mmetsp:Transcript_4868/g.11926  ORF Transcript_4868/g.11926 Transcript_4868/m.11926 type:complete len:328 (+) Transcript_4868:172-1155(+)
MTVAWPTLTWNLDLPGTLPAKKRIFSTRAMPALKVGTEPGLHTSPRSTSAASSCVTHTPTRSPCTALFTGRLNICMLRTCLVSRSVGSSTVSPTHTLPASTVPVSTVPWPLMGKQWSTANSSGPEGGGRGSGGTMATSSARSASTPSAALLPAPPLSSLTVPPVAPPPGLAMTGTMVTPANLVALNVCASRFCAFFIDLARSSSGSRSHLLSTTTSRLVAISPITRHSAVCVCRPFVMSTTSTIMSMICTPPMMVRMSEAWPGQSTSVNCSSSYGRCCRCSGIGTENDEKPRSSVMPRSRDWGCLSSAAVDSLVDRAATKLVFPLST